MPRADWHASQAVVDSFETEQFTVEHDVRSKKVFKTLRRCYKKAFFIFDCEFPRKVCYTRGRHDGSVLEVVAPSDHEFYRRLFELDAEIRATDDRLDEELFRRRPLPHEEIEETITSFRRHNPSLDRVADLFRTEYRLLSEELSATERRELLERTVTLSCVDFVLLLERMIDHFGVALSADDLERTWEFYVNFQRYKDLRDDVLKLNDDLAVGEFNAVADAVCHGLETEVIVDTVERQFDRAREATAAIDDRHHRETLQFMIDYWAQEAELSVLPILAETAPEQWSQQLRFAVTQK